MKIPPAILCLVYVLAASATQAATPGDLAPALEVHGDGLASWQVPGVGYLEGFSARFERIDEGDKTFVRLAAPVNTRQLFIQSVIPVPEGTSELTIKLKYRAKVEAVAELADPSQNYFGPRLETGWWSEAVSFAEKDSREEKELSVNGPKIRITLEETKNEWQEFEKTLVPPAGAAAFTVRIGLISSAGTLDIESFEVIAK